MASAAYLKQLSNHKSRPFRRAFIKRRLLTSGLFEDTWTEITEDVKKWGKIVQKIDDIRQGKINFRPTTMVIANDSGRYNPEDNENSLWFGFASQQRTLLKIECGFKIQRKQANGIYVNSEVPGTFWDKALYDENEWDKDPRVFTGIVQGDITVNDRNEIVLNINPLTQVLRDYPARNLDGYTSAGMTATRFVEMIRDQTDGASQFIFRPFFGNTTTFWNIQTTTSSYTGLSTQTAQDLTNKSVWDVVEKLSEAENYTAYIGADSTFNFVSKDAVLSVASYNFNGVGTNDRDYGIQIKSLDSWGFKHSKYYSRVQIKHKETDSASSYEIREAAFQVAGGNNPWNFGHRTLTIENQWLNTATAITIADAVFNNISSAKKELMFTASFVPHLNINDRLNVSYDSNPVNSDSLWDLNDWADTSGAALTGTELTWDPFIGNAIKLENSEYRPLSITIDLDNLSTKIISKEL